MTAFLVIFDIAAVLALIALGAAVLNARHATAIAVAGARVHAAEQRQDELEDTVAALTEYSPPLRGRQVTVHTVKPDDQTITGWLTEEYPDRIFLEKASYVTTEAETPIPGRQVFYVRQIAWLQDHGPGAD